MVYRVNKLKDRDIDKIAQLYTTGLRRTAIAEIIGCSLTTVTVYTKEIEIGQLLPKAVNKLLCNWRRFGER